MQEFGGPIFLRLFVDDSLYAIRQRLNLSRKEHRQAPRHRAVSGSYILFCSTSYDIVG